jgi:hypothetical protein
VRKTIDKGMSMLNATDVTVNPYGLILSKIERETIYGDLTRINNWTNALLYGKTARKQKLEATFITAMEFVGLGGALIVLHQFSNFPAMPVFLIGVSLLIVQKLNLLLTVERIEDTHTRRQREDEKEAKERARYFKDMGVKDLSLEE